MVQGTCFESTVLCLSGFPQMVKAQIEAVCRLVQARHTLQLKRGRSTHLICARPDGPKYDKARKWKIRLASQRTDVIHVSTCNFPFRVFHSMSTAFLAATALTGVAELVLYCPAEVMKTQLQVGRHESVQLAAQSLWRAAGVRGMYMGGASMLYGNLVSNVAFFCTYASIQREFGGVRSEGMQPSTLGTVAAGGVAGAMYVVPCVCVFHLSHTHTHTHTCHFLITFLHLCHSYKYSY